MFQRMVSYKVSHHCKFWFSLWFLTFACSSYALSEDKEKVMHVMADSADLSQQQHKGIYTGNVELIQGTTNLRATKAITLGNEKSACCRHCEWSSRTAGPLLDNDRS